MKTLLVCLLGLSLPLGLLGQPVGGGGTSDPIATEAEMVAGVQTGMRRMSPELVKDAVLAHAPGASGDMLKATYDPTNKNNDAFSRAQHHSQMSSINIDWRVEVKTGTFTIDSVDDLNGIHFILDSADPFILTVPGGFGRNDVSCSFFNKGAGTCTINDDDATSTINTTTAVNVDSVVLGTGGMASLMSDEADVWYYYTQPAAVADGTTPGIPAFVAADFVATAGVIGIDYTNAQAATASLKGFVTAADWTRSRKRTFPLVIDNIADSMNYGIGYVDAAFTITQVVMVHRGGSLSSPDIDIVIKQGTDRSAAGTTVCTTTVTSATTGSVVTSFDDATCPSASFLWFTSSSKSGTTDDFEIYLTGTYD